MDHEIDGHVLDVIEGRPPQVLDQVRGHVEYPADLLRGIFPRREELRVLRRQ